MVVERRHIEKVQGLRAISVNHSTEVKAFSGPALLGFNSLTQLLADPL